MDENELFRLALGLAAPWIVETLAFSVEQKRLDITLNFPRGSKFLCPECGQPCGVYDTEERTWRHLNFFQHETYLHARQPRIACPEHKVRTVEVPWARPGAGFTLLFEALVMVLARNGMTPNAIGRLVGEYDTLIWRILEHYVEEARSRLDLSAVTQVGLDETSRAKGHQYVTVFMDLDERRIVFATEGKDAETLTVFKADLEEHGGQAEQVEEFCLDMSPAFQKGIEEEFPQAQMTFDQFHLMKLMNEAVDEVRREEQKERPELKGSRYVWLKNEWNHTERQKELFGALRALDLKTNKAHHLKGVFQDIFTCSPEEGESLLKRWYYWATHSRLLPIIEFAQTVKRHWEGVVRWFQTKISNGLLEGMNSLIQAAKARSRGFRNVKNFITMIYLVGAKLEFKLPEVLPPTHTK
jgi:transposase